MSAERTPPALPPSAHETTSWLGKLLVGYTRVALSFPMATLAIAIGLAAVCCWFTATNLGYKTSRLDLLDPKSDYNRLWIDYIHEFGDQDDVVVVVEGTGHDAVVPVLQEIASTLTREDRYFKAVLHEVDLSKIRAKGLHFLPAQELREIEGFLAQAAPIINGGWNHLQVGTMALGLAMRLEQEAAAQNGKPSQQSLAILERFSTSLLANLNQERRYQSPWPGMPEAMAALSELSPQYLLAKEGKLGFVLLRVNASDDGFVRGAEAIDELRSLIQQAGARHPNVKIGLTGLTIMENDEMRSSQSAITWSSVISFFGVVLVVIAGFGGVRHTLLANCVLLIGMAWAFGYATLAVGHLNILSVTFTATLIGVGIDFGTYYAARYMQLRRAGHSCHDAIIESMAAVGPGIFTGAVTIAVAFFSAGCTSFTGVAELGIISGGGIMLCAVAQLGVLPALIFVVDRSRLGVSVPVPVPVDTWLAPFIRFPRATIGLGIVLTFLMATGLTKLWYDHNLLNLQARNLESVDLERKLLSECDRSVWYAMSIAKDREELLARKERFLQLPSVERCEEIVSMLPADHDQKRPIIERLQQQLASLSERPSLIPVEQAGDLGRMLGEAQVRLANIPGGGMAAQQLEMVRNRLRQLSPAECEAELSQFQQFMAGDLLTRLHTLRSVANPNPPELSDLPPSLVSRFVGKNGRHLLKIYGKGDIWNLEALGTFVKDVRSVDPRATGNPLQAYEASLEMKRSYEQAALYALVIISGVLLIDFRNIKHAMLAALPLALGMVQTFGLLGLLNIPVNPANLIALPLLLGMGVDYGVHIVHEYLEQPGRYRISRATAVAVMVDALTTLIGFAALMIASHQGLQSLGRVLSLGVTLCILNSLIVLPCALTWLTRNRENLPPSHSLDQETGFEPTPILITPRRVGGSPIPGLQEAA